VSFESDSTETFVVEKGCACPYNHGFRMRSVPPAMKKKVSFQTMAGEKVVDAQKET
jgi:hypothetical protein